MLSTLLPSWKAAFNLFLEWRLKFPAWTDGKRGLLSGLSNSTASPEATLVSFCLLKCTLALTPSHMLFHLPGTTFFPWAASGHLFGEASPEPQGRPLSILSYLYFHHCNLPPHIVGAKRAGTVFFLFFTLGIVLSSQPTGAKCPTHWLNERREENLCDTHKRSQKA